MACCRPRVALPLLVSGSGLGRRLGWRALRVASSRCGCNWERKAVSARAHACSMLCISLGVRGMLALAGHGARLPACKAPLHSAKACNDKACSAPRDSGATLYFIICTRTTRR